MSSWGPPARMPTIIDLTSDDDDIPASKTIDLTSLDEPEISNHDSLESKVKVEDQSSPLAISSSTESGESSPKVPQDYETSLTESNHTDAGELSPRNPGHEDDSSSEDNLTLNEILARKRKRNHVSDDVGPSQSQPIDAAVPITREALGSLVGSQPLKPGFAEFFHKPLVNEPSPLGTQRNDNSGVQQESQAAENSNRHILNVDREELFGNEEEEEKKRKKHRRELRTLEKESANRQVQLDQQILSGPVPSGGVSETARNEFRTSGASIPSQPLDDTEIQRPRKRLKPSRREAVAEISSFAVGPNTIRNKLADADRRQCDGTKAKGGERSSSVVNKAAGIGRSTTRHRPGGLQRNRWEKAAVHERSQKKPASRLLKKLQDVDRGRSDRQQGGKKHPVAAQNEWEQWERGGSRPANVASQQRFENNPSQRPPPRRNQGLHEARGGLNGLVPGATAYRLPLESDFGQNEPVEQDEGFQEPQELPDVYLEEPQMVDNSVGQQESRSVQPKLNTTHLASRVKQLQPTKSFNNQTNDLEDVRTFFKDRYAESAQKRKTILVDSVPADLGKPSYAARRQMVQRNAGGGSGPNRRKGIKDNNAKRTLYRQRAIESKRQVLQSQVDDEFRHESKEDRERRVEAGLAELRRKFERNDQKREAQKSQGLLTVDFLEDIEDTGPIDRLPATAAKGKQRGIPVSEALEPGATILLYAVYTSDAVEKGVSFDDKNMKRLADQFLKKEDANKHAEEVLRNDRLHDSQLVSIQFRVGPEDGLFFGIKELADGKTVMCMVQSERQICGELNLRDIFVEKALKEVYSPRFDVFYITVTPKVFLEEKKAEAGGDKKKKVKAGGHKEKKPEAKAPSPVAEEETEPGDKENVDEDSRSLFSDTPDPEPEAARDDGDKDEKEDEDADEDEDEGSDADSVNTDITISPSEPGGNLGSLSWKDVEYLHEHVDGFTTLELANKEAVKVARELWKPKGSRMDPWLYYRYSIEPSLNEVRAKELDVEAAELEFEVPDFEGHVEMRPWPFIYSKVFVEETRLEGPRDIGNYIVMDNGEESDRHDGQDGAEDGGDG
ncbi:hypothetical protein Daus18300_001331 [Diaporthe australafricana]|uniref:Uncharacterized protein n=1 Tax=Diaporthe australafricana TaxID=127596 RepID=A0ABR3XYL4_9PEZI